MKARERIWSICDLITCGRNFSVKPGTDGRFCSDECRQKWVRTYQRIACRKPRVREDSRWWRMA